MEVSQPAYYSSRRWIDTAVQSPRDQIAAEQVQRLVEGKPLLNVVQQGTGS